MTRWLLLAVLLLGTLAQGEPVRVGIEAHDYYPYYRAKAEGAPQGYAVELLQAFARYQGLKLELRAQPINRLYHNLLNEQSLDLLFPDNPAWSRQAKADKTLHYSDAAIQVVDGTLATPHHTPWLEALDDSLAAYLADEPRSGIKAVG